MYVKRFDPSTMQKHRIILLIGKRGTGKSTLINDLMSHLKSYVNLPFAMTPTEESTTMFESCMPNSCIHPNAGANTLQNVIEHQRKVGRKKMKQENILLVLDDMMYDKKIMKSVEMRDIFMNGRHLKITLINAMQYCMDMGPDLRTQIDYVFALRENIISNLTRLWKYFFGMFTSYSDFEKTFKALTEDNGAIVIDNTVKSNQIKDCIFWYKASIDIPPYKLGRSSYWKLCNKYYKTEDEIDNINSHGSTTAFIGNGNVDVQKETQDEEELKLDSDIKMINL